VSSMGARLSQLTPSSAYCALATAYWSARLLLAHSGAERVADAVAQEVEAHHHQQDRQPGKGADPPLIEGAGSLGHHPSPLRGWRRRAEAEEAETGQG